MTRQEVHERYHIPVSVLLEYERRGFCRAQDYTDEDLARLGTLLTFYDIGFSAQEAEAYLRAAPESPEGCRSRLRLLEEKRSVLLDEIHTLEQKLTRLDYLRHDIRKRTGK